jgi:hypothetical protein
MSEQQTLTFGIDNGVVLVSLPPRPKQAPVRLRLTPADAIELGGRLVAYGHAADGLSAPVKVQAEWKANPE